MVGAVSKLSAMYVSKRYDSGSYLRYWDLRLYCLVRLMLFQCRVHSLRAYCEFCPFWRSLLLKSGLSMHLIARKPV